jgi:hypothetical protein
MASLTWVNAKRGNPENGGVILLKTDGSSLTLKPDDHIHFGDSIPVRIVGFRFSGRTVKEGAGQPTSIMYKNMDDEKGECFVSEDIMIRHTGYGKGRTGLELIQCI